MLDINEIFEKKLHENDEFWKECRFFIVNNFFIHSEYGEGQKLFEFLNLIYTEIYAEKGRDFNNQLSKTFDNEQKQNFELFCDNVIKKYVPELIGFNNIMYIYSELSQFILVDVLLYFKEQFKVLYPGILIQTLDESTVLNQFAYYLIRYQADGKLDIKDDSLSYLIGSLYCLNHEGENLGNYSFSIIPEVSQCISKLENIFNGGADLYYKIEDIDFMSGLEFEKFLFYFFVLQGYECTLTPSTNDQGLDLIAKKDDVTYGIQAKRYVENVGNKAVQEVIAGALYYKCDKKIVITNSYFTTSAIELAKEVGVDLWDRNYLDKALSIFHVPRISLQNNLNDCIDDFMKKILEND